MLTKVPHLADKAPVAVTGVDTVRKDDLAAAPQRKLSAYRAMGQGDLHPNELYA